MGTARSVAFDVTRISALARRKARLRTMAYGALFAALTQVPLAQAAEADCSAQENWFPHQQTPRPDDAAFVSSSNCVFHQWAWQMFLWLTQEVDGQPRFLGFVSPLSLVQAQPRLLGLDSSHSPGGMQSNELLPRVTKSPTPRTIDEYLQAGTEGILIDQDGRAVYASQYVNPTYADFITGNDLTDPAKVRAMHPATMFPITDRKGAMELKASWKIVGQGEDASTMFTMDAEIAKLVNRGGKIVIDPSKTLPVKVALVGFHIGGVVQGHPEMIWATFEHRNNAPNVPAKATADTVVSKQDFTFYRAGTTYANCNRNPAKSSQLRLDEATQKLSPVTQVCRRYEFGNAADSTDSSVITNDSNIKMLNASVAQGLDSKDVWKNYFEVGAIWFLDGSKLKPGLNLADDALLTGSLLLSNATVETFTQTQSTMANCFRCHNTQQEFPPKMNLEPLPPTNLNISHAFQNIYFWSQETAGKKALPAKEKSSQGAAR